MKIQRIFEILKSKKALATLLILAASLAVCRIGESAGGKIPNYPVSVTFRNATEPADNIQSVGDPTYTNGEQYNGQVSVSALISSASGWVTLSTRFSTIKKGKLV